MHINKLINPASLKHDIKGGFIRVQTHPTLPLKIYNYTEKAQFAKHWNTATLTCRGLIVHDNGTIVARPFPKFFNWDEPKPKGLKFKMGMDEPVVVADKLDGSLGILYRDGRGGHRIATRGSFASEQAMHGNEVWRRKYVEEFEYRINPNLTYLFEIIYPDNRIVVDYKGKDDLVLLGAVDIEGGFVYGPEMVPGWPGPRASVFPHRTLRSALQAKPRPGKEGFVVRSLSDGLMVKVKYEDYVALHRVVTGLNEREIWRRCMKADLELDPAVSRMDQILQDIPDELHGWVKDVAERLAYEVYAKRSEVHRVHNEMVKSVDYGNHHSERGLRKAQALWLHEHLGIPKKNQPDHQGWLRKSVFQVCDGNDPQAYLWKTVEPRGDVKK